MPTDHGPELEALRKRLADAKEFADLAGKEREPWPACASGGSTTCGTARQARRVMSRHGRRRG